MITEKERTKLKAVIGQVGIRNTCKCLGWATQDDYYNIIYGRSNNRDKYQLLLNKAAELITQSEDHNE